MNDSPMTVQMLQRLPYYLQYLKGLSDDGVEIVSAPEAAESLGLNEVLVRKDFSAVICGKGKPKVGFCVQELTRDIEDALGYHTMTDAVLVGVGSLGRALFAYEGFESCGLRIQAGFDKACTAIGDTVNGKAIYPIAELTEYCRKTGIRIGIIAVPASAAQSVCDSLIKGGIAAIWNFAPVKLSVPKDVLVHNENLVTSLTILSRRLKQSPVRTE